MKQAAFIIIILTLVALCYYVFTLPPKTVPLSDIHPVVVHHDPPEPPDTSKNTPPVASPVNKKSPDSVVSAKPLKKPKTVVVPSNSKSKTAAAPKIVPPAPSAPSALPDSSAVKHPADPNGSFYVIVESLKSNEIALQRADELKKKYRTEFIVLPPTKEGYIRISWGKYSTPGDAIDVMKKIKPEFKTVVWILADKK